MLRPTKTEKTERRRKVALLYLKGYSAKEICQKLNLSPTIVAVDIKTLDEAFNVKTIRTLEYRKSRILAKIQLEERDAAEIREQFKNTPSVVLATKRVMKELLELEAKVEGVIAEKLTTTPDIKASQIQRELKAILTEAEGDGHKKGEEIIVKQGSTQES